MWIILGFLSVVIIYFRYRNSQTSCKNKGKQEESFLQLFCDAFKYITGRLPLAYFLQNRYNSNPSNRYYVINNFFKKIILVRDPDLIKQITVKDFDHFLNHVPFMSEDVEPLWKHHIPFLNNQAWKQSRNALSPVFTNSKFALMIPLFLDVAQQFVEHFSSLNTNVISLEMNDCVKRFTNDIIANIAFGVKCNSLKDKNNEFYIMGGKVKSLHNFQVYMKMLLASLWPQAGRLLNLKLYTQDIGDFFGNIIRENRKIRSLKNIFRPDIVHFLLEAKRNYRLSKAANKESSFLEEDDLEIVAQQFNFILSGFYTVSSLMSFVSYELAINPDVQDKLIKEVDEVNQEFDYVPTYEAFTKMIYFNMVVSETLRMWPGLVNTNRVCTSAYTIQPKTPDEDALHLEKNDILWIPIYALHRDAKLFPDPDKFDPERFSKENEKNIDPYSYIPFGAGPRKCMAYKFALLEAKILFYSILTHFTIIPDVKTSSTLKISKKDLTLNLENGYWLALKKRKGKNS